MNSSKQFLDSIMAQLEPIGEVTSRAMFGGYGIFHRGVMFALISDDVLYFKVNHFNRDDYVSAGSSPFAHLISYWQVPTEVCNHQLKMLE